MTLLYNGLLSVTHLSFNGLLYITPLSFNGLLCMPPPPLSGGAIAHAVHAGRAAGRGGRGCARHLPGS